MTTRSGLKKTGIQKRKFIAWSSEKVEQYGEEISKLAKKLRSKRVLDRCRTTKKNKGDKINYKFDKNQKLMTEVDELVNCLYDFSERYQYGAHKSNSISGLKEMESNLEPN